METIEILTKLLHLGEDWTITEIKTDNVLKEVDIFVTYKRTDGLFPRTEELCPVYDYSPVRRIRHLNLFEYKTYINCRIPRVKNKDGEVQNIKLKWADSRVSYTYLFEDYVLALVTLSKNQTKTADFLDSTFDVIHSIVKRGVKRGLKRRSLSKIQAISLDEKRAIL